MVADLNVKLTEVGFALADSDATEEGIALSYVNVLLSVEDCLLPVSVFLVRGRAQKIGSCQSCERCIEPRDKAVNSVVVVHLERVVV